MEKSKITIIKDTTSLAFMGAIFTVAYALGSIILLPLIYLTERLSRLGKRHPRKIND